MFTKMKIAVFSLFLLTAAVFAQAQPKYIFLFIGDGMGEPHVIATEQYVIDNQVQNGVSREDAEGLVMTSLPVTGEVVTYSKNRKATCSAASATAFSSGYKVDNGALNMCNRTGRTFEPMDRFAKNLGLKVGIIASCPINHATPAGFYAIAPSRNDYHEIAIQMAQSDVDYFGGAYVMRVPSDEDNIRELAADNDFTIVSNKQDLSALQPGAGKVWAYSPMPYILDGEHEISLAEHTRKAIELLADSDGFFMMVEGAQIDWAGHANDAAAMIYETIEFDKAIAEAVEFYHQNPDDTLIIVTADHETGGLTLDMDNLTKPGMSRIIQGQKGSRNEAASVFRQIEQEQMSFEEALPLMKEFFGVSSLTQQERENIQAAFIEGGDIEGDFTYGDTRALALEWVRLVSARAGLVWTSTNHTPDHVPLYAIGAQADLFAGYSDNALISWYLRGIMNEVMAK